MTTQAIISSMLALQDDINTRIHAQWREQRRPWYRAIWVESAELLDHYGWKWWKHQATNIEQLQLELVDIWHFGLSDQLQYHAEAAHCAAPLMEAYRCPARFDTLPEAIESFVCCTLNEKRFASTHFFGMMPLADLDLESLYRLYVSKNVLNFFRQDHGYQEGAYQKNWGDKEDNECLADIIAHAPPVAVHEWRDYLYQQLTARYRLIAS